MLLYSKICQYNDGYDNSIGNPPPFWTSMLRFTLTPEYWFECMTFLNPSRGNSLIWGHGFNNLEFTL